jgi:hypothetical protein
MLGNWGEFGQYANEGDTGYMKPQITEGRRQAEEENKLAYYDIDTTKFIQQYLADIGLAGTKYAADIEKYIQTYISDNNLKGTIHTADIELAINKYISDNNLKGIIETNKTSKEINTDNNTTTVKLAETGGNTEYDLDDIIKMLKNTKTPSQEVIDAYNKLSGDATKYTVDNPPPMTGENVGGIPDPEAEWTEFTSEFTDEKILKFINEKLRPYFDNNWEINEETLEKLIVGSNPLESNSTSYDIDVEEAKAICKALGLDDSWVDKYKNRWGWNKGKGMKLA